MFVYFWERGRQSTSGGGAEREGDTESEAGSRLWAFSTESDAGLERMNLLSHSGTPGRQYFYASLVISEEQISQTIESKGIGNFKALGT